MNFNHILNEFEQSNPEAFDQSAPRRDMLRKLGKGFVKAAIPAALTALATNTYAKTTDAITDIAQLALLLERMHAQFYNSGLNVLTPFTLIPNGQARTTIQNIATQEGKQMQYWSNVLVANGINPGVMPSFDFTAGGKFSNVFTNYETFLAVAQLLEDLAVRAYKGQAANLMSDNAILTAALNIHSVAARHSAIIRKMRRDASFSQGVKPWISGDIAQITGVDVSDFYLGESNTVQLGYQIQGIATTPINIDFNAASEAFDEVLTAQEVTNIVSAFLVP